MLKNRTIEAAHLLRRAGFGGTLAEINKLAKLTHAEAVAQLLDFVPVETAKHFSLLKQLKQLDVPTDEWGQTELQQAWLELMLATTFPLQEKLTLFWHGHFTSSIYKVGDTQLMAAQNEYFRRNCLGNFGQMLRDISADPAMLIYLDGVENSKDNINENFARELMELFSLGLGQYTEQDIREAARAFSGWSLEYPEDDSEYRIYYDPEQHDNGVKTFMGKRGNFAASDIINLILKKREAAYFVTRKLWEFLAYPKPENSLIKRLGDRFYDSDYNIKKLVESILLAPEFLAPPAYRALVKSPVELVVGTIRALGGDRLDGTRVSSMGQSLFAPPNVRGWLGGKHWINSATFLTRVNFTQDLFTSEINYRYLVQLKTPIDNSILEELKLLLLDNNVEQQAQLQKLFNLPLTSEPDDAEGREAEYLARLYGLINLLMSYPQYQLA